MAFGVISGLLVVLWLALALVGASAQLHRAIHPDSHAADHSCVIEHINQGSVLFASAPLIPVPVGAIVLSSFLANSAILPSRDFRVALSRGPPSFPTFRTVAG